jgi:hypothetical protein
MLHGAMSISIMAFGMTTFITMTLSMTTFSITYIKQDT